MPRHRLFMCLLAGLVAALSGVAQTGESQNPAARTKSLAALAQLDRQLEATPNDLKARLARGQLYIALGARSHAFADFEAVYELDADNAVANEGMRVVDAMELHSFGEVEQLLDESATALLAGQSQRAADSFHLASLYGANLGEEYLGSAALFAKRGDRLAAAKQTDLARADYRLAVYSDGELSPDARIGLARLLAAEKKFPEAIAEIDLIKTDEEEEKARASIARREILAFLPLADRTRFMETTESMLARAKAFGDNGNRQEALDLYDFILLRNPRLIAAYEGRARHARTPEAAARDQAIIKELNSPEPALPATTDAGFALAKANRAVHRRPFSSRAYAERSLLLSSTGTTPQTHQQAITDAQFAIELQPFNPQAHRALAEALISANADINAFKIMEREEQTVLALKAADRAVTLAPNDFQLLFWRGRMESDHGIRLGQNQRDAFRFFTRAIAQDPTSTDALFWRAVVAEKEDRHENAAADYRSILKLDSSNVAANYSLGWSHLRLQKYRDAVENFKATQNIALRNQDAESAKVAGQLHAIALAMAGDDSCDAIAQTALAGGEWTNDASIALNNFTQKPHTAQLDRLKKMKGKTAP